MRPNARTLIALVAASAAALWGSNASAASERIVCQQDANRPSMADCVLISPSAESSATGATVGSPHTVTYDVVEPIRRNARAVVVVPVQSVVATQPAGELRQPSVPQPYPSESSARNQAPEVRYIVADRALPAAAPGEAVIVPAERIFVTEPAQFPSVTAPPWPD